MNFFFTSVAGFNVTVIYKNGFMRKFLFFALSAIFTAGTPAGCNTDYNAISYFVWVNDSDHKITLFVESDLGCEFKNEVILPGESFTAMDNGMGVCPVPSSYIWKMTIYFRRWEAWIHLWCPLLPGRRSVVPSELRRTLRPFDR